MSRLEVIQIITGAIGSVCFAILFNVHGRKLLAAALGGGMGWLIFVLLSHTVSEPIAYFIVSMCISVYAEAMARILKAPATLFIIPSLIPLIPGASLYYTMTYAIGGDRTLFLSKAISTLKLAVAIAGGIIVAAVIMKLVLKILKLLRQKREEKTGATD